MGDTQKQRLAMYVQNVKAAITLCNNPNLERYFQPPSLKNITVLGIRFLAEGLAPGAQMSKAR